MTRISTDPQNKYLLLTRNWPAQ